jgi:hypothetical protein
VDAVSNLRRTWLPAVVLLLLAAGCGGDRVAIADESILTRSIAGTSGGAIDVRGDRVTKLLEVVGDWNDVSVRIAEIAIEEGWTIESINCVGTGNDVIARKNVDGTWLLLESGAGTRGAGLIVSIAADQRGPRAFTDSGRCPQALLEAASRN